MFWGFIGSWELGSTWQLHRHISSWTLVHTHLPALRKSRCMTDGLQRREDKASREPFLFWLDGGPLQTIVCSDPTQSSVSSFRGHYVVFLCIKIFLHSRSIIFLFVAIRMKVFLQKSIFFFLKIWTWRTEHFRWQCCQGSRLLVGPGAFLGWHSVLWRERACGWAPRRVYLQELALWEERLQWRLATPV